MVSAHKVFLATAYPPPDLVSTMKYLFAVFLLAPIALLAQENPSYDPDYNGDGCYSVTDILGLLPLFGSCVEDDTTWACGDSISYWGSTYATGMIGDQCWFKDNLKTTRYTDGSPIHPSSNYGAWNTAGIDSIGAYSVYYAGLAQDSVSCSNGQFQSGITEICDSTWVAEYFGYLYNWHVINSPLSLCPSSWHVPSDEEWINYELLLGMSISETDSVMTWSRGAADSVGFNMFGNTAPEWATYAFQVADDSNSISCTPSGLMLKNGYSLGAGSTITYWSSSGNATSPYPEVNPFPNAWMRQLDKNQPGVWRTAAPLGHGGYVRCLRDAE